MKFPHPCPKCGGATFNKGPCDDCIGLTGFDIEAMYRTSRWRKLSERKRIVAGRCERCGKRRPTETHHIIAALDRPDLFYDWSNLMAVCGECHDELSK